MIDRSFFEKDSQTVAKALLGKGLRVKGREVVITETEAYPATDMACYGKDKGGGYKITNATKPLFEKPGTVCIYSGMILISCKTDSKPDNVLIRCGGNSCCYFKGPYSLGKFFDVKGNYYFLHSADILSDSSIIQIIEKPQVKYAQIERIGLCKTVKKFSNEEKLRFVLLNDN